MTHVSPAMVDEVPPVLEWCHKYGGGRCGRPLDGFATFDTSKSWSPSKPISWSRNFVSKIAGKILKKGGCRLS